MPTDTEADQSQGYTRRNILGKFALGLAGLAGAGFLFRNLLFSAKEESPSADDEFPGPESIFHPRRDPRLEARERRRGA